MRIRVYVILVIQLLIVGSCVNKNQDTEQMPLLYKDSTVAIDQRVDHLLALMTIEEKVAQMQCVWEDKVRLLDSSFNFNKDSANAHFPHGIGQVGRPSDLNGGLEPAETARLTNEIQRHFVEHTRLGIPVVFHEESLHGHAARNATSFPQPIGLASTFDTDLIERLYAMSASEVRAVGGHQVLTPVVDVAREPRWGRVEETYGEDPYLSGQMGVAAVRGFQGDGSFRDKKRVLATLKHMAGHGQPESGMNISPANYSERIIREIFLHPFKEVVTNGGVASIMASYNEIDGVPSHANTWMMRDVLRAEWGFDGYVVSDYYALRELNDREGLFGHGVAANSAEAARLAIAAGINIELPERDVYHKSLLGLVKGGVISEQQIDELVAPMLRAKFRLGLFDDPYVNPEEASNVVGHNDHSALAREAASKAITLLQNKKGLAPLSIQGLKNLAVIGPNADRSLLGGYSGSPKYEVSVLEGIRNLIGQQVKVRYAEGCKITTTSGWGEDEVLLAPEAQDRQLIAEAVAIAKKSDVIILTLGGNEQTSREAWSAEHMGDRTDLQLVGRQNQLIDALAGTGKPIIAFVFNGRPLAFNNLLEKAETVFECWYLGQETGSAVADVLVGKVNPSGKLPISIPRSVGHIPVYYNYKPSARRGYLFDQHDAMFSFGYGLSYTTFQLENLHLSAETMSADGRVTASIELKNTGKFAGAEVVQLYIRDRFSSVTRPVRELKGFQRVELSPGKSKVVEFIVSAKELAFYDINMDFVVEPGDFDILVGTSSRREDLQKVTLTVQ
ncbi:MAG: glycoside hydrolase family 3 N-terminal domain-containing protein [Bacteroidota bacterium]